MAGRARISVVVPYFSGGCPHRIAAWRWVRTQYERNHPDWQVVEGHGGTTWVKAEAVADGLKRATGDVLFVADADVWVNNFDEAVQALVDGAPWVMPHHLVHRLNPTATERVLDGSEPASAAQDEGYDQDPYPGWAGGGVVVLRRADYERAPMDHRFRHWGQEDASWAICLDSIVGPHARLDADLWHLWHPPQPRLTRVVGSREGEALWLAYRQARRRPARMAQLVAEGKESAWQSKPG